MTKHKVRLSVFNYLGKLDPKIKTKLLNISGKTGKYNVPDELFQKRTSRKNRVLISWKTVKKNKLTIDQLKTFSGGVVVEFVNEDFFAAANQSDIVFNELKKRIGSEDIVSSIISIRSESGSSSSAVQRQYFNELINNTEVIYKEKKIIITKENFRDFAIKQISPGGLGNEKWSGFLFVSIKGGQQDTINSHYENQTIFNPACEYANADICLDIDLVLAYFAMISINKETICQRANKEYNKIMSLLRTTLKKIYYDSEDYIGNLLEYCDNHISTNLEIGKLYDPIQVEPIDIMDFAIDDKNDPRNLDLTHNEAVTHDRYYWDRIKKCILTPARPTNLFWSKHLSNMMQQNFSLEEYFQHEKNIIERRNKFLSKKNI